ncbi:hypothetical protein [Spirillospora sp. CA-294931]|uniref:hypothetical protein n=1 Tax=Spirillospora sp. CA-294931 TaxID=3240042 RepID=UPI003D8B14E5
MTEHRGRVSFKGEFSGAPFRAVYACDEKGYVLSSIVKFFVATKLDAMNSMQMGPDVMFPSLSFGNFDVEGALLEWESWLTSQTFAELVDAGVPEVVAESGDGPTVFLLSDAFVDSLVSAPASRIDELALWWVGEKLTEGIEIDSQVALEILHSLVGLVRQKRDPEERVYCWTG